MIEKLEETIEEADPYVKELAKQHNEKRVEALERRKQSENVPLRPL